MLNIDWAKRSHKGLRKWVLHIVNGNPRTGAEIMDIMESASQGWWRPSPGSVYPLLESMVKERLLSRQDDKKYALTDLGRQELEAPFGWFGRSAKAPPRSVDEVLEQMSGYVSYLEDLSAAKDEKLLANLPKVRKLRDRISNLGEN